MKSLIIPIAIGAAAAAALTYLFATEDGAEVREKIKERFPEVGDQLNGFKDRVVDKFSGWKDQAADSASQAL